MEQPEIYKNLQELIDWLKYDLEEQRKEIAKERGILQEEVDKKDLTLNIGMKVEYISDDSVEYIEINFEFNLNDIIYKLFDKLSYEDIGCYINCDGLIFNNKFRIKNTTFCEEVNFNSAQFNAIVDFENVAFDKEVKIYNYISIDFSRIYNSNIEFNNILFIYIISALYIKDNTGINKISIINAIIFQIVYLFL